MSSIDTTSQAQVILAVQSILASAANWRESRGRKYPSDVRNQHGAKLLRALASDTTVIPEYVVAELSACRSLEQATKETARRVGFSLFPATLAEFLASVLLHISEQQKEIDRAFPSTR
jgi:hypothetical protein